MDYDTARRNKGKPYEKLILEYRDYLTYERQLAFTTTNGYVYYVSDFGNFVGKPLEEGERKDVKDFIKYMRNKGVGNSTVSSYIIALRSFYNYLTNLKNTPELSAMSFYLSKVCRVKRDWTVPEVPKIEEIAKLRETLHAFTNALAYNKKEAAYLIALRDTAILEMLIATGVRSFELRKMQVCDVDINSNQVLIRAGKGGAQRVAIFSELAQTTIKEYLLHARLAANDRIFVIRNGNMLNYIIKRWAKRANINEKIHAHSFRHFHVTEAQRQGVPLIVVANQVGHESLNTTQHYTHFDLTHRREKYKGAKL